MNSLFVYGSLAPGQSNQHLLAELPGSWQPAHVQGRLEQLSRGAAKGYLAIELDDKADEVPGLLFCSKALAGFWPRLDAFEGVAYRRVLTSARLENGSQVEAYVYEINRR
ncbi:gamma-glutamylcyclotransferase [Motiliproteus coralliicola]|uniref:Gamma-glutamylcyclotransferase n=1 Tax=Motiliproteus coralliicola TaxID=2283196 RepID=A0A369WEA0_9GAMM|nr:gamma-glutamylcyclotransferase [Motiliproteus coralliicola]